MVCPTWGMSFMGSVLLKLYLPPGLPNSPGINGPFYYFCPLQVVLIEKSNSLIPTRKPEHGYCRYIPVKWMSGKYHRKLLFCSFFLFFFSLAFTVCYYQNLARMNFIYLLARMLTLKNYLDVLTTSTALSVKQFALRRWVLLMKQKRLFLL